jgi:hypothetical protein
VHFKGTHLIADLGLKVECTHPATYTARQIWDFISRVKLEPKNVPHACMHARKECSAPVVVDDLTAALHARFVADDEVGQDLVGDADGQPVGCRAQAQTTREQGCPIHKPVCTSAELACNHPPQLRVVLLSLLISRLVPC